MGAYKVSDMIDVAAYVVNGWDVSSSDGNQNKTIGTRVGINAMPGVNIGVSVITGTANDSTEDKRTVLDIDATITMIDNLTIGVEINSGTEENANLTSDGDGDWTAFLLMAHYDLDDTYGVTARYDTFDDEHGSRLGNSIVEKQTALTLAGTMSLGDGAGLLAEWRRLDSDQNVFNGSTEDSTDTFAVEFTYSF
jgi:predicted porin